ncbi:hypothetical protein [Brevibacterium oceani]|uniref:hypothetical protein n=1 Tax=Brevibacterium oceani TaxID=358099 RepID=UPI0015E6EFE1|nr:hypothetical protein [Brevibacterium oceani]
MASNSRDPEQTNKQRTTPAGESPTNAQHHSQTLPLITEEIAANNATARTEATNSEPVTTPVMPPNPIRREEQGERAQPSSAGTARLPESQSSSQGAAVGAPATAAGAEAAEAKAGDGEEKKSEGRISATQLIAGAGAAATSSVIGGQLGVAGTVIGAGIASIVTGLAVTLYSRSLDKGKEKIKEVGSKLAPAVKAQIAKNPVTERTALTGTTEALPTPGATHAADGGAGWSAASAREDGDGAGGTGGAGDGSAGVDAAGETEEDKSSWWQKLRRKRVLYPAAIGVAAFGIGLGGVVMAESFTDADLSPGTSQLSRSVSGQSSTADESGTDSGTSDSGSSGDGSGRGSQSGTDGNQGSTSGRTDTQNGQSTSAGDDTGTQSTNTDGTDQGTDSTTGSGSDTSGSTTADGTDTASGTSTSSGGSSSAGSSGGSNSSGSASGGSNSGSSGSGSSGSGSSGSGSSGSGSSGSGSGGGGAASAQG